jgi:ABC transporter DrrB family efflux protein
MTDLALAPDPARHRASQDAATGGGGLVGRAVRDVAVLTRRNLQHIAREPLQLSDVTVQPILFTLLFVYVFGSGVSVPGGYKQFAIAGLIAMNLTTSAMGTAVGLISDIKTGVITRFRTLPMWRPAILIGRTLSDVLSAAVCLTIVVLTGLAIGWRPHASVGAFALGIALPLLFSYALSWLSAIVGLLSDGPESAQGIGLIILFPLAIVSNSLVPTAGMPTWLRDVANWNPVSALTSAVRDQLGSPNPAAGLHAWPMEHPVAATLLWCLAIIAVCAPLAVRLYRRRTTD